MTHAEGFSFHDVVSVLQKVKRLYEEEKEGHSQRILEPPCSNAAEEEHYKKFIKK